MEHNREHLWEAMAVRSLGIEKARCVMSKDRVVDRVSWSDPYIEWIEKPDVIGFTVRVSKARLGILEEVRHLGRCGDASVECFDGDAGAAGQDIFKMQGALMGGSIEDLGTEIRGGGLDGSAEARLVLDELKHFFDA